MKHTKKIILAAILSASSAGALAIDGTIEFRGSFIDTPCTVDINGDTSGSVSVPLGTWTTGNFENNVGATTDLKPIKFVLSGCPDMSQANIRFNGDEDSANTSLFAIEAGAGSASAVGIGMYKSNDVSDIIEPNSQSLSVPLTASAGEVTIYASYMTTGPVVGSGNANADVTIDISYE